MAKNRPGQAIEPERSSYSWRDDALREYENGSMTRAVAVLLGIIPALPFETVTSIDHNYANDWRQMFLERGRRSVELQQLRNEKLRRYGHVGGVAGKLDY